MNNSTQGSALRSAEDIAREISNTRYQIDELEISKIKGAVDLWKANVRLVELDARLADLSEELWALERSE